MQWIQEEESEVVRVVSLKCLDESCREEKKKRREDGQHGAFIGVDKRANEEGMKRRLVTSSLHFQIHFLSFSY